MPKETYYHLSEEDKKELDQKLKAVLEFCQIHHIPFFAGCAVENDADKTEYLNIVYSAQSHAMELTDDQIRKHMLIANGKFDVVPKREVVTFSPFGIAEGKKP